MLEPVGISPERASDLQSAMRNFWQRSRRTEIIDRADRMIVPRLEKGISLPGRISGRPTSSRPLVKGPDPICAKRSPHRTSMGRAESRLEKNVSVMALFPILGMMGGLIVGFVRARIS